MLDRAASATHRIFAVEDHPVMRAGYARLLGSERDLDLCGDAVSAEEALDRIARLRPDLVLVDLALPGASGIELIKRLRSSGFSGFILAISTYDEALYAERVLAAGAQGYVMKREAAETVVDAIRRVLAGHIVLSDDMRTRLVEHSVGQGTRAAPLAALTDREVEVLEAFGGGRTAADVAQRMGIGLRAVENHRVSIKRKLGIDKNAEFFRRAVLWVEGPVGSPLPPPHSLPGP